MSNRKSSNLLLFLIGVFSQTQIRLVGSIGISELVIFIVAPFLLIRDWSQLERHGFMPLITLAFMVNIGCILACLHNGTEFAFVFRGVATTYSLLAIPVVFHALLWNNLDGLRWVLLGGAISSIITIFGFYDATELYLYSQGVADKNSTEAIMGGQLFWLSRLGTWFVLPVQGWYFQTPIVYSFIAPLIMTIYTILTSPSGRSALLTVLMSVFMILYARKSVRTMKRLQRHIVLLAIVGISVTLALASAYKAAAQRGLLNDKAQKKYEMKVANHRPGMLGLLMSGRSEVFIGITACLDNPFWGFGPWAIDYKGYYVDFLRKYGTEEDWTNYQKCQKYYDSKVALIPSHSMLISFWLNYGLLAFPFWLYVLYLIYDWFRHRITAIPHWYGYFCLLMPSLLWNILFSPYTGRIVTMLNVVTLVLARSVGQRRIPFPEHMRAEACKHW